MLKEQEQEEKKMEMMRKDREENVKRKGLLPRRRKKELAAWLEKAGYALMAAKGLELMVVSSSELVLGLSGRIVERGREK